MGPIVTAYDIEIALKPISKRLTLLQKDKSHEANQFVQSLGQIRVKDLHDYLKFRIEAIFCGILRSKWQASLEEKLGPDMKNKKSMRKKLKKAKLAQ